MSNTALEILDLASSAIRCSKRAKAAKLDHKPASFVNDIIRKSREFADKADALAMVSFGRKLSWKVYNYL